MKTFAKTWTDALGRHGFALTHKGSSHRLWSRERKGLRETIGIQRETRSDTYRARAYLEIYDPFYPAEEPVGPWMVMESQPLGGVWTVSQMEDGTALAAAESQGIGWLEELNDPPRLAERFEAELRDGIARPGVVRRPPANHHWLALLYHQAGDREGARRHAEAYLNIFGSRKHLQPGVAGFERLMRTLDEAS